MAIAVWIGTRNRLTLAYEHLTCDEQGNCRTYWISK